MVMAQGSNPPCDSLPIPYDIILVGLDEVCLKSVGIRGLNLFYLSFLIFVGNLFFCHFLYWGLHLIRIFEHMCLPVKALLVIEIRVLIICNV